MARGPMIIGKGKSNMKAYAIVCRDNEFERYQLMSPPVVFLSMEKAREKVVETLDRVWHKPYGQQFNIDKHGVETVRYIDREGYEICRIITLEVM